ncbi:DPP IV N-terminal domain-containing protein [Niabella sp. CJ426]|uniref:S9 family peptidase n=1 Tax=Niabella sp. CJ426 TaxID=3393740 RepID=UPI003D03343A
MFRKFLCFCLMLLGFIAIHAQSVNWGADGNTYYKIEDGAIVKYTLPQHSKAVLVPANRLTPSGSTQPIEVRSFVVSKDESKVLIYNNTRQVWREDTRGDYWVLDLASGRLQQLGKGKPEASLMFAKLSPDNTKVAYVSEYNLYVEDLASGAIKALTTDGNRKNINGTFDWAYEEEFFCRDGFRWAPDSKKIAYWKIIAGDTKVYNMVNNTDSIYPKLIPIEYPVAGEKPSVFKIGVVSLSDAKTQWMNIADDAVWGSYVPRMEWAGNTSELIVQHLNRRQNESNLMLCNAASGAVQTIYTEKDSAWIDIVANWDQDYTNGGWDWLNGGKEFLWPAEKNGWRHLYRVSRDGKKETLITKGKYDVMDIAAIDEKGGYLYFHASPENATQKYLYRTKLNGAGNAERLTPADYPGTNSYNLSPGATYAVHSFSNYYTHPSVEWITVADHKPIGEGIKMDAATTAKAQSNVEFITVTTEDGVQMDAWMAKPANFDASKKYPVVFYVYTEPWGQTVKDSYGAGRNFLYKGDMAKDGYIYVSIDSRGTPVPKGRTWRKALYKNIGILNIHDQAMAAKALLKQYPYLDGERTAVWGWSGGGSTTLNLMFQFPEIYKTGIAVAAVGNQRTYDNIYQERYSGIPQQDETPYIKGSPVTHAKNLKGNLLYIHGTGDDNVHYNNAEMLFNELIKYNRQFQMMSYPNRSHSIAEGEGTSAHLQTLYTNYLRQYCPPGAK